MIIRTLLWPFVAAITVTAALAQQSNEGAYSCAAQSSGGIIYNSQTKKWEGTSYLPLSNFIVTVKYVRTATTTDEYAVTITPIGRSDALPCISFRTQLAQIDEFGYLVCRTDYFNYKFNLKAGRFVEAYMMGYVDGRDANDDTPMLSGGVCTKIQ